MWTWKRDASAGCFEKRKYVKTKDEVRSEMRALRRAVDNGEREAASASVCRAVWARADFQAAVAARKPVAVYLASESELDLSDLIERLWEEGVTVAVPYWHAAERTYRLAIYTNTSTLIEGAHRILEPAETLEIAAEDIGVWVVPGLAFTRDGRRIGYGGGWYDRLLARRSPEAVTLGVAYPFQMTEALPTDDLDQRVKDVVVAEEGV